MQVEVGKDEDDLPLVYDPDKIAEFWARRPVAVATRVAQLLSIGGGFITGLLWDLANGSFAKNEVCATHILHKRKLNSFARLEGLNRLLFCISDAFSPKFLP